MVPESRKPHGWSETGRSVGFGYDDAIPSNSVCYSGAQVPFGGPHCGIELEVWCAGGEELEKSNGGWKCEVQIEVAEVLR